jgi:hypothetical protein
MVTAARCYLTGDATWWPLGRDWWKPKDRRQDLIRAGALAMAEMDRLRRVSSRYPQGRIWAAIHDQLAQETAAARALLQEVIAVIEVLDVMAQKPQL